MAKNDFQARLKKFVFQILVILFIFGGVYALYLYNLYRAIPKVKTEVAGAYSLFTGFDGYPAQPAAAKKPKVWTQINARTSDAALKRISSMSDAEVKKKVKEVEGYDKILNSNSMKLIKMISGLLAKKGGGDIMSSSEEKKTKDMINEMLDAYKNKTYPGIKEIEKETGKL